MPFNYSAKKIGYLITSVIIVLICVILWVFIRNRISLGNIHGPQRPEDTKATISIQNFRHTSTKDGRKEWSIEANSASLFAGQNIARLSDISASFILKNNESISLTADSGIFHTDTDNLKLTGNITVKFSDYIMTTENLNYFHKAHMININTPVMIQGKSMALKANTLTYNLKTDIIRCSGNVDGTFTQIME